MASFGLSRTDNAAAAGQAQAQQQPMDASTPWVAAADGNLSLLQASLQALQLTCAAQDEHGYTLLQAAVSYNRASVWEWLATQPGFAVHTADAEGDTALHYAGTAAAARFLVEHGVDVSARNYADQQTALEKKRQELEELRQDEDFEETDEEYIQLKGTVEYLSSLTSMAQ